jgi:glycosyltransferase involved in cell wall biosynthesis
VNEVKVSVIIPTYNDSSELLSRSLLSVLRQSHQFIEVIVVDDGSDIPFDGIEKVINDTRVTWHALCENQGVAAARNKGVEGASGEFVAFLDTGDWWEKEKLQKQLDIIVGSTSLVFVYTGALTHDPYGNTVVMHPKKRGDLFRELLIYQPIIGSCSSVLVKREALKKVGGFYQINDIPEDRELWLRLSKEGTIDYVSEPLTHIEIALNSRSTSPAKKLKPYKRFLKMYEDDLIKHGLFEKAWGNLYISLSDKCFRSEQWLIGMKFLVRSFRIFPSFRVVLRLLAGFASMGNRKVYFVIKKSYVFFDRD